jgi:hypothetical protein
MSKDPTFGVSLLSLKSFSQTLLRYTHHKHAAYIVAIAILILQDRSMRYVVPLTQFLEHLDSPFHHVKRFKTLKENYYYFYTLLCDGKTEVTLNEVLNFFASTSDVLGNFDALFCCIMRIEEREN